MWCGRKSVVAAFARTRIVGSSVRTLASAATVLKRSLGLVCCLAMAFAADTAVAQETDTPAGPSVLWYRAPAQNWEKQALPIGNGRLGGMIFEPEDRCPNPASRYR